MCVFSSLDHFSNPGVLLQKKNAEENDDGGDGDNSNYTKYL